MAPPKWAVVGIGISICAALGEYKAHRVAQAARRLLRIANHLTVWRSAFVYLAFKIDTRPTGQTLPAIAYTLAQIIAKGPVAQSGYRSQVNGRRAQKYKL